MSDNPETPRPAINLAVRDMAAVKAALREMGAGAEAALRRIEIGAAATALAGLAPMAGTLGRAAMRAWRRWGLRRSRL